MRLAFGIACLAAGCGRIGFDATGGDGGPTPVASVFSPIALPQGGDIDELTRAPDAKLYAIGDGNHVFVSSTGSLWNSCSPSAREIEHLVVDDVGVIYTTGDDGVQQSRDGCASWQAMGMDSQATSIARFGSNLLVGTPDGISQWNGTTWSRVISPMDGHAVHALATDATTFRIFIAGDNGVARSTDGGSSWTLVNTGFANGVSADFIRFDPLIANRVLAQAGQELFYSTDDGATWQLASWGGFDIALDAGGADFAVWSAWNVGDEISNDGGQTFDGVDHRSAEMHKASTNQLLFLPGSQLLAATNRGMFFAPDHSLGWSEVDDGLDAWSIWELIESSNGDLLLGTPAGVLKSDNGGATWAEQTAGLAIDSVTAGVAFAPNAPGTLISVAGNDIWQSIDGAVTWSSLWTAGPADAYHFNRVHVLANGTILAATWGGMVVSDTSWSTFTHYDVAAPMRFTHDVVALDPAGVQLLAPTDSGLYYSADSGASWASSNAGLPPGDLPCVLALPGGMVLAGTSSGIYRASSPLGPWTQTAAPATYISDLVSVPGKIIAATEAGVLTSTDGQTWTLVPGLERFHPTRVHVDMGGRLLVGTAGYGLWQTRQF